MQIKVRIWFDGWVRYLSSLTPPGNLRMLRGGSRWVPPASNGGEDTTVPTRSTGAFFASIFIWGGDGLALVAIGRPWCGKVKVSSLPERKQALSPPYFLTRALPLSTKSQCVEIFSSPGDLPESAVGSRSAIGRQLSIYYRFWLPDPCTRSIGSLPHSLRQGVDQRPSAKRHSADPKIRQAENDLFVGSRDERSLFPGLAHAW